MKTSKPASLHIAMMVFFAACLCTISSRASAQQETVLFSFAGSQTSANGPLAGVIFDAAGNLYGTTGGGGNGFGTVFELTPAAGGGWSESILYSFGVSGSGDGNYPASGLTFDSAGNLYGTTKSGGAGCNPVANCGTVFELTPNVQGGWTEKILHSFQDNGVDGTIPQSGLVVDAHGNLFGATLVGGAHNSGIVYELMPTTGGHWKEKVLHTFGNAQDGNNPSGNLIFDAAGNLYGTTSAGGSFQKGTAFELTPSANGGWKEKILHSFGKGTDGADVQGGVIFDSVGNLYGTTNAGGAQRVGTVFELSPQANGAWTAKTLHNFNNSGTDGLGAANGVIIDAAGNLYGATQGGGPLNVGTVFELSPTGRGAWTEKILHDFDFTDGSFPDALLIFDASGNLYGTTLLGGANSGGEVFEITP